MMLLLLLLAIVLFGLGILTVLTRKNTILILIGIELIFNACNLNLIVFGNAYQDMESEVFTLFMIVIAACESAVALAILVHAYRHFKTVSISQWNELKDQETL